MHVEGWTAHGPKSLYFLGVNGGMWCMVRAGPGGRRVAPWFFGRLVKHGDVVTGEGARLLDPDLGFSVWKRRPNQ